VPIENHECMARIPTPVTASLDVIDALKSKTALVEQALALDGPNRWVSVGGHWAE